MAATSQAGSGTVEAQPGRQRRTGPELQKDDKGYPLLPAAPTGRTKAKSLQSQKDLVRTFLVMHYRESMQSIGPEAKLKPGCSGFASGRATTRVPWKQISEQHDDLIDAKYLPPGSKIKEPSSMVKEELEDILTFWRGRQQADSGKETFRFKHYFADSANKELEPATYGAAAKGKSKAPAHKRAPKKQKQSNPEPAAGEVTEASGTHGETSETAAARAEQRITQPPAQQLSEGSIQGSNRGLAAPYSLGLPAEGNCNMNEHDGGPYGAAAGTYQFPLVGSGEQVPEPGGLDFDLNGFNFDPDLARIAMQYAQPPGSGYLDGEGGFLDNFLDQLNADDAYGFPAATHGYANGAMAGSVFGDQPNETLTLGPIGLPAGSTLQLPMGETSNDIGTAEGGWEDPALRLEQGPREPAAAASMALQTINQNEMQAISPTAVGPNVTTRASSRAQQEAIPKRPRGRPKKIVANTNTEGQPTGLKRGLEQPENTAAGPSKKAKTADNATKKTPAPRKPTKHKAK